jgi:hypothetical protein
MNERQASALQRLMQDRYPDAVVNVKAQDNGAEITISGPVASPGCSGNGRDNQVRLAISDDGPFMRNLISNLIINSGALAIAERYGRRIDGES